MAAIRFLFNEDFAAPRLPDPEPVELVPEIPKVELEYHLDELKAQTARAHEEGYAQGIRAGEVRSAERLAEEAGRLVAIARSLIASLDGDRLAIEKQAIDLALEAARHLSAGLVSREPLEPIRAILAASLGSLRKAPHLVLRLAAEDTEAVKVHVDRIARETGFEGRIVILGEADLLRGDCRIEWADGGIVRDSRRLSEEIEAAVQHYIEGRERAGGAPHADPVRPNHSAQRD